MHLFFCLNIHWFLASVAVVMVLFPNSLTEEEEALQKKYAKLKKKVTCWFEGFCFMSWWSFDMKIDDYSHTFFPNCALGKDEIIHTLNPLFVRFDERIENLRIEQNTTSFISPSVGKFLCISSKITGDI